MFCTLFKHINLHFTNPKLYKVTTLHNHAIVPLFTEGVKCFVLYKLLCLIFQLHFVNVLIFLNPEK